MGNAKNKNTKTDATHHLEQGNSKVIGKKGYALTKGKGTGER